MKKVYDNFLKYSWCCILIVIIQQVFFCICLLLSWIVLSKVIKSICIQCSLLLSFANAKFLTFFKSDHIASKTLKQLKYKFHSYTQKRCRFIKIPISFLFYFKFFVFIIWNVLPWLPFSRWTFLWFGLQHFSISVEQKNRWTSHEEHVDLSPFATFRIWRDCRGRDEPRKPPNFEEEKPDTETSGRTTSRNFFGNFVRSILICRLQIKVVSNLV